MFRRYVRYWIQMFQYLIKGNRAYFAWIGLLSFLVVVGLYGYTQQLEHGLFATNMTDQVSWGVYIANFTFLVGVAAAAVLLVVPTYIFDRTDVKEVVLLGELLAASAMVMCLLFVVVDLGRPDRFIHILPFFGRFNLPSSVLAWDVIVINGYLLLNLHIPGYLLYRKYCGEEAKMMYYVPFIFISIAWAISIHTVTAFLYGGLGGRPFWNTAILAPRFLVSAFASGPAFMILIFEAVSRFSVLTVRPSVITLLKKIIMYTLPLNMFLLGCELFKEFYTNSVHTASAQYLYFGLHGHSILVPYIWTSILFSMVAIVIFSVRRLNCNHVLLRIACIFTIVGIWIEKGMGLLVPGFVPSPLGEIVEYSPSSTEFMVCLGIWAFGALLFSLMAKVAIAIQTGELRSNVP